MQECVRLHSSRFADQPDFKKMHEQFSLLIDPFIDLFECNPDAFVNMLVRMEHIILEKTGVRVAVGFTLSVFALPESLIRLVSLARSAKDRSVLDSVAARWRQEHLFSSITHASSIHLEHMEEYFQVATILSDLGAIDFASFDPHMLDFLPNHVAIDRWHHYVAAVK